MSIDEQPHVALPKLYGQPAYARLPRAFDPTPRPPELDDLPIEAVQTDEEREVAAVIRGEDEGAAPEPTSVPSAATRRDRRPSVLSRLLAGRPEGPAPER